MDEYGFGSAMKIALELLDIADRGSGRTTRMIIGANDDDRIIVVNSQERRRIEHLLRDAGKTTKVMICDPSEYPHALYEAPKIRGRNIFDHEFIKGFLEYNHKEAEAWLHKLRTSSTLESEPAPAAPTQPFDPMISKFNRARLHRFK